MSQPGETIELASSLDNWLTGPARLDPELGADMVAYGAPTGFQAGAVSERFNRWSFGSFPRAAPVAGSCRVTRRGRPGSR